ncbi:hemerythrin domain-containing protein [Streptomyces iconiensis]|uniref:Hemerythrin domain-containing protein n=1 Tax=Streptomyces iconiensis TaxID=1384038 RepID=A0ABT6ZT06_9ACTN|nr:hemerythrin domain-containing protein [Streptomyces iconiensis]MDJ1132190.1 hemerythrin domain-containing protein [Streptomyces iconiensis]
MSTAQIERAQAARLPEDDVVGILLTQHARIRDLFAAVRNGPAERRQERFDQLRMVLAVHETAEEMVVRPRTKELVGEREAEARNEEEKEATKVLSELERLDVDSERFRTLLDEFEESVSEHADREEREEFTVLRRVYDQEQRSRLGKRLLAVEKVAPTHPHPATAGSRTAQWAVGPFASLVDRARDAVNSTRGPNDDY